MFGMYTPAVHPIDAVCLLEDNRQINGRAEPVRRSRLSLSLPRVIELRELRWCSVLVEFRSMR